MISKEDFTRVLLFIKKLNHFESQHVLFSMALTVLNNTKDVNDWIAAVEKTLDENKDIIKLHSHATCSTCKWWVVPEDYSQEGRAECRNDYFMEHIYSPFQEATIQTPKDFGCIHHEGKE